MIWKWIPQTVAGNSWKLIKILISWSLAKRKRKWRFPDGLEFAPSNIEQKHAAADRELFGAPECCRVLLYLVHMNFARHHGFCSLCMLLARVCRWTATSQIAVFYAQKDQSNRGVSDVSVFVTNWNSSNCIQKRMTNNASGASMLS